MIASRNRPIRRSCASRERGGFLLEALVGILIFTLGVLGLVALQGRAIAYTSDAQYRGEAAYLANAYVAKMWADARANIPLRYIASGQTEFDAFEDAVFRLPGAAAIPGNPSVTIVQPVAGAAVPDARGDGGGIALTDTGTLVTIVIQWRPPKAEGSSIVETGIHNYTMTTVIAHN
jgi:type IV pilus assembly protein PilV